MTIAFHCGPAIVTYFNPNAHETMNQYKVVSLINGRKYTFNEVKGATEYRVKMTAKSLCSFFNGHTLNDMGIVPY